MLQDADDDLVPDVLKYEDFIATKLAITADVAKRLRAGYSPSSLLRMDSPKGNLTLRAGAIPELEDRLVYTAIAGVIADVADKSMEAETVVPSYRVRIGKRDEFLFRFPVMQWFKFQDLIRAGYDDGYRYMFRTDLTAYFDHIDHESLKAQLAGLGVHKGVIHLLGLLLDHWLDRKTGIPQGSAPSSLLGNLYLDPLDKHMIRRGYRYFRYMDDICVFGHSRDELQRAAIEIIHQTRLLGLHIQTAKTQIHEGTAILALVNERQSALEAIDYGFDINRPDIAVAQVHAVLKELLAKRPLNERHFRKCLNSLRRAKSPDGVPATLKHLDTFLSTANQIAVYLRDYVRTHPSIRTTLIKYLMSPTTTIYEWPEYWFTWTLQGARNLPRPFLDWARTRMQYPECHWAVRAQLALLLGSFGDFSDRTLVLSLVPSRENDYERRGFIRALSGLPNPQKAIALRKIELDYPSLAAAVGLTRRS
ncbi:MAG: RNA-directed DNA polymerase [Chloroflexota bacterium]|nr:RNA-directed DNA polymerase [Chloroflexota bacterium]